MKAIFVGDSPVLVTAQDTLVAAIPRSSGGGHFHLGHVGNVGTILVRWACAENEAASATAYSKRLFPGDDLSIDNAEPGWIKAFLLLDEGEDAPTAPNLAWHVGIREVNLQ